MDKTNTKEGGKPVHVVVSITQTVALAHLIVCLSSFNAANQVIHDGMVIAGKRGLGQTDAQRTQKVPKVSESEY